MSTTTPDQSDLLVSPDHGEDDPFADVFDAIAFHTPEVWSRCFERIREVQEIDTDGWGQGNRPAYWSRRVEGAEGGHTIEIVDQHGERTVRNGDGQVTGTEPRGAYGYRPIHRRATFCSSCGSESGRADDDPLSRRECLRYCENLATRLVDVGLVDDTELATTVLKRYVREAKSRPGADGRETEIFRWATERSVTWLVERGYADADDAQSCSID